MVCAGGVLSSSSSSFVIGLVGFGVALFFLVGLIGAFALRGTTFSVVDGYSASSDSSSGSTGAATGSTGAATFCFLIALIFTDF